MISRHLPPHLFTLTQVLFLLKETIEVEMLIYFSVIILKIVKKLKTNYAKKAQLGSQSDCSVGRESVLHVGLWFFS